MSKSDDKDDKLKKAKWKVQVLEEEISQKEDEKDGLEEYLKELEEEITRDRILKLKKDKKVLETLLKFTKRELDFVERIKEDVGSLHRPEPQTIGDLASAYESILAAAPSRLRYSPCKSKLELNDHDKYFFHQFISNSKVMMIGANASFSVSAGIHYGFIPSRTFTIRKDGVFLGSKKLEIDFRLIFNAWEKCLTEYVCKDIVSVILVYLHGNIFS